MANNFSRSNNLTISDHSRDSAGLRYIYAVVSRRAHGVSVGINLNTNNACNWRCIYCQVPGLARGSPPPVDMGLLERELRDFLHQLLHGDYMQRRVPEDARRIADIALSGNGEPTSAEEFSAVVGLACALMRELLPPQVKLVLITNGSLMQRENVREGLRRMAQCNGEVWFKLDRASEAGMLLVNGTRLGLGKVREHLSAAISCCPNTWLQTCWFGLDGASPDKKDEDDYVNFLASILRDGIRPHGVLLYTLARPSLQPEASRLSALPMEQLEKFAARIRALGMEVLLS